MSLLQVTSCGRQIDLAIAQDLSLTLNDEGMGDSISVPVCDGTMTITSEDFSPLYLFQSGEQGVWFDPSDFSTMFQDSAGTTPVTAVEQAVGRILDKSGRGNHATQSTPTSRPILRARYNLLTYSEQFNNAAWVKSRVTINSDASVAPDGTTTADKIEEDATTGFHRVSQAATVASGVAHKFSVSLKAAERTFALIYILNVAGGTYINLANGTVHSNIGSGVTCTVSSQGNGWYRVTASFTTVGTSETILIDAANAVPSNSYAGTLGSGIFVWGADLRPANESISAPAYQRIVAATNYDTSGFPQYLDFDGTDDWLITGTISPAVDKVQVFAGARKLTDTSGKIIAEFSTALSNSGSFSLQASNGGGANYLFGSRGTAQAIPTVAATAPDTAVLYAIGNISGDVASIRRNEGTASTSVSDQGTGNYGNYALYIGSRAGTSLRLAGRLYGLIVRFNATLLEATTISNTEAWMNLRTGAY